MVDRLGEFQEVVVAKLQHGKSSIEATASTEETATAATATSPSATATAASSREEAPSIKGEKERGETAAAAADVSSSSGSSDMAVASASGQRIVIVHVTTPAAVAAAEADGGTVLRAGYGEEGETLLSLHDLSISTPDGSLALVDGLNLQVGAGCVGGGGVEEVEGGWR